MERERGEGERGEGERGVRERGKRERGEGETTKLDKAVINFDLDFTYHSYF